MSYAVGDHVTYANYGVCTVSGTEQRPDFHDPSITVTYYVLEPTTKRLGKVRLPESRLDALRPALTREEAIQLIDSVKAMPADDFTDSSHSAIEDHFRTLLRSGRVEDLVCVVKSMHKRIDAQKAAGKSASASFVNLRKEAKHRLDEELGYALGVDADQIETLITSHTN